ncbi:MerR family transcriptional regulator [Clostridium fungisolvens]|uniref:Putative HTH-type transcriptional regulator n=1 Tax=Clostridium fungisolvens TaxID=1604897 RepID=A0A6V8SF55_9CLOT|nr:MerR family transcriptional regulator [Clostridium fungisolvens]GFP75431.1 putative HTH-type transcriptional regulator [Clostridium fungisolvens]
MTIGEFSELTGISCSALRYYEDKGLINVERDAGNRRIYCDKDVEWVKFLQRLKDTGMPLKEMKHYSDLRYQGDSTISERLEILEKHEIYVEKQRRLWEEYSENLKSKILWYKKQL